jgi:hypothetical protein
VVSAIELAPDAQLKLLREESEISNAARPGCIGNVYCPAVQFNIASAVATPDAGTADEGVAIC